MNFSINIKSLKVRESWQSVTNQMAGKEHQGSGKNCGCAMYGASRKRLKIYISKVAGMMAKVHSNYVKLF